PPNRVVPKSGAAPLYVAPESAPAKVRLPEGCQPSSHLSVPTEQKSYRSVYLHFPLAFGLSLNTTPELCAPPSETVPYRLPAVSTIRLAVGSAPSAQPGSEQKLYSVLCRHLRPRRMSSKTVPAVFS